MSRLLVLLALFLSTPGSVADARAAWQWPVSGDVITPYRNGTDPYATGQHRGIDIAAPAETPVRAAAGGEVRFAGTAGSSGLTVSIRTGDGYDTSYLHLASLSVRAGAQVEAGNRLGAVGTTGTRSATEPHLHFGVRTAGERHAYHDPLGFLPPPGAPRTPPEAPSPAPSPERSPAPPLGAPAPVQVSVPDAGPKRAPRGMPRPLAAPRPEPAPLRRPTPASPPAPLPVSHRTPEPTTARKGVPRAAPAPTPPMPTAHRAPGPQAPLRPAPTDEPVRAVPNADARPESGPDMGWALACAGLLLAAGVLGLTEDGRRTTRRTGTRVAGALRPILGRR